jgi:DNA-binding CsgD family transcriptional regulator
MACGLILVDATGQVLSVNDKAQRMLRNGLYLAHGRIEATDPLGAVALSNALKQTFDTKKRNKRGNSFLIPRGGSRQPYIMHTYLMIAAAKSPKAAGAAIVIIIDPDSDVRIPAVTLAGFLKLPPGEARVAAEIANGLTPRDAARNLGLTENSVRVILKRVYYKVNISRQAELVLLASRFGNCTPDI